MMSLKTMKTQMKNLEKVDSIANATEQNFQGNKINQQVNFQDDSNVRKSFPTSLYKKPSPKEDLSGINRSQQLRASNSKNNLKLTKEGQDANFFLTSNYSPTNEKSKDNTLSLPQIQNRNDSLEIMSALNTSKILNKSKLGKDRIKLFEADRSIIKNEKSSLSILPRLKESINIHTEKEITVLKSQNDIMKKELDNLVYQK